MNTFKEAIQEIKDSLNTKSFQLGSYSITTTLITFAILLVINIMANTVSSKYTQIDMSSAKLYSLTSQTKAVINQLEEEVTIYWIVQSGEEDSILEKLLERYEDLNDHVTVVKKDPDAYPTFVDQYTDETYSNNCLIVESGEKYRYISIDDIYPIEDSYYASSDSFDGEGVITSAIDYVVNTEFPDLYLLEGHGEQVLSDSLLETFEKENINTTSFSLLTEDGIPEEADCVMIYAPQSDISQEEKELLMAYLQEGGKLLVLAGPTEENTLPVLESILLEYGIETHEGIVIENDRQYYALGYPYLLLPDIETHDITTPLIENNYYSIIPISKGYEITDNVPYSVEVTSLLTSSVSSYLKVDGYALTTYEHEDGDIAGPFTLALAIEEDLGNDTTNIIWFGSSKMIEEGYDSYSSGANTDLLINSLSWALGEDQPIAIRSKSLGYEYLVVDSADAEIIQWIAIGLIPLSYLAMGIYVVLRRRNHK